jgi:hypothetical protein
MENYEYNALSYVWGDQTEKLPLVVRNSQTANPSQTSLVWDETEEPCLLDDSRNLHTALLYLRARDTKLFHSPLYWIDAVCIDQKDLGEKQR